MRVSSPQRERRRALRRQKRRELLANSWRTLVLVLLSGCLGWLLLRFGWTLEDSRQVVVVDDRGRLAERVVAIGEISFPTLLLEINPVQLERRLMRDLPMQSVRVRRLIAPARLEVRMQPRQPVARASRRIPGGMVLGLVDRQGLWIQPDPSLELPPPSSNVMVDGWTEQHSGAIATLLAAQSRLSNSLRLIVLRPDGSMQLDCERLGRIELGRNSDQLAVQIAVMEQLGRSLPASLISNPENLIDLSNPERPEIELPKRDEPEVSSPNINQIDAILP